MPFFTFPLQFLQACISAFVTCSAAWAVLRLARLRWPGLSARRAPWLMAQCAGCLTVALLLLPAATRFSLFAAVPVPIMAAAAPWHQLDATFVDAAPQDPAGSAVVDIVACLWLALYGAGVAWHMRRWARAQRGLTALLRAATRLDVPALASHPAFALHRGALPAVLEIDAPVSPLLAGLLRPVLLLPRHVRSLPPAQQQLIVAHELTHLRRRDHLWQHAGLLLRVVLWFVPAVHSLYQSLQWAVETGCDRAVLACRPASARRSYAAALVAQLALQVRPEAALAFGTQPVAERIRLIRAANTVAPAGAASMAMLLLLPAFCGATVLFQPRFVLEAALLPLAVQQAAVDPSAASWQAPLQRLHVNSAFGATNRPGGKAHGGVDLRARRGTAVMAPAAGRVAVSTDQYAGGARYGKVIAIDHPDGSRSLYAHLDARLVQAGDVVQAGQQIALSGATGKVTGPHLHFEVSRDGANIDPLALLSRP